MTRQNTHRRRAINNRKREKPRDDVSYYQIRQKVLVRKMAERTDGIVRHADRENSAQNDQT